MKDPFKALQEKIQIKFHNIKLLKQAFTHASYVNEHKGPRLADNERLEFLGDAVLQLTVSEYLYTAYPRSPEGELTRMRASIVCEASLVHFAEALEFAQVVLLGKGEERTGGRTRPSLLADVFESFLGALYLDQGLDVVRKFLDTQLFSKLPEDRPALLKDYKTLLQEKIQYLAIGPIEYQIIEEKGPAHDREFMVVVSVGNRLFGKGLGRSKKEAEQKAACKALQLIDEKGEVEGVFKKN